MKQIASVLLFTVFSVMSFAQAKSDGSKHLTFKGVPIDGTLDQYVSKMKQSGFSVLSKGNDFAKLEGDFAGYKECIVGVSTLKQRDLVYKISVLFPDKDTWSKLSGNYFESKQLLSTKYGKHVVEIEKFDVGAESDADDIKMYQVGFDNCKYHTIWKTENGEIKLSIDHAGISRCFVRLSYFDKINGDAIKKQALDDL